MERERHRKRQRGEGKASINLLSSNPTGRVIELAAGQPASLAMPSEVRAFLISKLAEMLALDFQVNQYVSGPMVQSAGVLDHKPGAVKPGQREPRRAS